jgi:hypothetical protein
MTRRHFEAIAAILRVSPLTPPQRLDLACRLADYFAAENPRFRRRLFLDACGLLDELEPAP